MDIKEKVVDLIVNQIGAKKESIALDSKIVEDLGADSLDVVEMTMGLEEEFGLEIPDDAVEGLVTVGDIVEYIEKHKD